MPRRHGVALRVLFISVYAASGAVGGGPGSPAGRGHRRARIGRTRTSMALGRVVSFLVSCNASTGSIAATTVRPGVSGYAA